ncbi:MAG TPA: Ig domain-containing protein, partial [Chitinophagaceae bacterium]
MQPKLRVLLSTTLLVLFSFLNVFAFGQTTAYTEIGLANPIVKTDKLDYSPGEVAHITGSGWVLDKGIKRVSINITEDPWFPDVLAYWVDVDENGNWSLDYQIESRHIGVKFTVIATGLVSNYKAETYFTDGNITVKTNVSAATIYYKKYSSSTFCPNEPIDELNSVNANTSSTIIAAALSEDRVKVIAPAFSDAGGAFISWSRGGTTVTTREMCIIGDQNTQNWTANYSSCVAPSNLNYSANPATYCVGTTITNNMPSVTGMVTSYSVSPELPAGLSLNTTTGVISGTPTAASAAANYTITATNSCGSTTAIVSINVREKPEITTAPVADTECEGGTASFTVAARGT